MKSQSLSFLFCLLLVYVKGQKDNLTEFGNVFDLNLYETVLDPAMCTKQINYLLHENTLLLAEFLDAGIRLPTGIMTGNFADLGNYYQCLGIHEETTNFVIDGKYCLIEVPLDQSQLKLPSFLPLPKLPDLRTLIPNLTKSQKNVKLAGLFKKYNKISTGLSTKTDVNKTSANILSGLSFTLAVCIPKACTTKQALQELSFSMATVAGFEYRDKFCRLPNDKPWATVDYIALVVFSTIGLLTLLSTAYDLYHTVFLLRDPKQANKIYQSFSVYNNTQRLVTYNPIPGTLECLDGVRALAMMWVILGHSFVLNLVVFIANPLDIYEFSKSLKSLWLSSATITVDTFFMLSGLLLVYTVADKLTRRKLVRDLHLFYFLRILRMLPILAVAVLLQASLLNHVADGPNWNIAAVGVAACRDNWWSTLMHVQNYVNPSNSCLPHTWYLAIDVQLYLLSPLVLFWILGRDKQTAWITLTVTIILALVPASIYNTIMEFPGAPGALANLNNAKYYMQHFYINTLTRCSSYVVGMIYGYLLHLYRGKHVVLSQLFVTTSWICAIILSSVIIYSFYPLTQLDWNNQTIDTLTCSLLRPAWAVAVGWLVFACVQGYGGPINWLLSLRLWKVLSRLSYAMYIIHYLIISSIYSSSIAPVYFSMKSHFTRFMADFLLSVLAAFLLTVIIDAPCTVLIKHFMGEGKKKQSKADNKEQPETAVHSYTSNDFKHNFKYMPHE